MQEVAEKTPDIYSYILQEESSYRTTRVPLASNWRGWNMYQHIDRSFLLKNSQFYLGAQDFTRPFNNVILPIANVNYRTEGFDVKDVQIYVDNEEKYHKSFLARKFHNWWARDNHIDTAIDESVESYFDYGLILMKNVNEVRPEVVQLQQIAFCDQTDVMSGPICLKHHYGIDELLDFKGKWKASEVDKTILMARSTRDVDQANNDSIKTPGKYVEVYELHGMFPESWLGQEKLGTDWEDTGKYSPQVHIVTFYTSPSDGTKTGITLFKGREPKPIFKALKRDPIFGRACGRGGIEELFHSQIWTNYSELHLVQMLEAVSKVVLKTTDKKLKNQKLTNMKHGQILEVGEGKTLEQLILQPINKTHFDNFVNKWEQVARSIGSASDPQLGLNPVSGTPLGTTEIVTSQGIGIHEYRQGKIAEFWAEIYRDWVIPHLSKEITQNTKKWLDDISLDELMGISDGVALKEGNKRIKDAVLSEKQITQEDIDQFRVVVRENFMRGGKKRFLEIIKGEFEKLSLDVEITIVNKQKNLAENVSKLNSLFRVLFTPGAIQAIQQNKGLSGLLNQILEGAGLGSIGMSTAGLSQTKQQSGQTTPSASPAPSPASKEEQLQIA